MPSEKITVAYINEPKAPRGPGSVKTADGNYYKVWLKEIPLSSFTVGEEYLVSYEADLYQGKEQRTIKRVVPANGQLPEPMSIAKPVHRPSMSVEDQRGSATTLLTAAWIQSGKIEYAPGVTRRLLKEVADDVNAHLGGVGNAPFKVQSSIKRMPLSEEMDDALPDSL